MTRSKSGRSIPWSEEELATLQHLYKEEWSVLEEALPLRTKQSMKLKMNSLGLHRAYKRLSQEEYDFIRENYLDMTGQEMADKLDRQRNSITRAIKKMGLTKQSNVWELVNAEQGYNEEGYTISLEYNMKGDLSDDTNS